MEHNWRYLFVDGLCHKLSALVWFRNFNWERIFQETWYSIFTIVKAYSIDATDMALQKKK